MHDERLANMMRVARVLAKYANHLPNCSCRTIGTKRCNCGFTESIAQVNNYLKQDLQQAQAVSV